MKDPLEFFYLQWSKWKLGFRGPLGFAAFVLILISFWVSKWMGIPIWPL
jgi:hypothetical protein